MKIFVVIKSNPKDLSDFSVVGAFETSDDALEFVDVLNDDDSDPYVYHFEKCQLKFRNYEISDMLF